MRKQGRITEAVRTSLRQTLTATINSIDGERVNIQFSDGSTLIRNVEVIGSASLLRPGEDVDIIWRDGRPVVVAYGTFEASSVAEASLLASPSEVPVVEARFTRSSTQSITPGTNNAVQFNVTDYDSHGMLSGTTDIVIKVSGLYAITANVEFNNTNATGSRGSQFYMPDGAVVLAYDFRMPAATYTRMVLTTFRKLVSGDTFQWRVFQSSGGNLFINNNEFSPSLEIYLIR